jgi:hypothetical protein
MGPFKVGVHKKNVLPQNYFQNITLNNQKLHLWKKKLVHFFSLNTLVFFG